MSSRKTTYPKENAKEILIGNDLHKCQPLLPLSGSPRQHLLQAFLLLHHRVRPSSPEGVWTSQRYDCQDLSWQPRTSNRIQPQKTVSFSLGESERKTTIWEKDNKASDLRGSKLIGYIYKCGMVWCVISFCMFQDVLKVWIWKGLNGYHWDDYGCGICNKDETGP